jgi:hypothetical protein
MDLSGYLPFQYTTVDEANYCVYMHEAFVDFYDQENYHFAYLAAHILLMYQIYLRLWQLSRVEPNRVIDVLTLAHFDKNDLPSGMKSLKDIVDGATSPMAFKIFKIEERVFVKILTLLESEDYGPYKKAVDFRNLLAHANGALVFHDAESFEVKINELIELFRNVHISSKLFLSEYISNGIKERRYSRPYVPEEIELDIDQLFISQLMLTPYDCFEISEIYPSITRVDRIAKDYFLTRAQDAGIQQ